MLSLALDRIVMQNTSLSRWHRGGLKIEGLFSKQALQVMWDFAESNPMGPGMASWAGAIEWVAKVIEHGRSLDHMGVADLASASECPLPDDSVDLYFTDPPYLAAIQYADLYDVFYVL